MWSADRRRMLYFVSNRGGSLDLWQQRLAPTGCTGRRTQRGHRRRRDAVGCAVAGRRKLAYSRRTSGRQRVARPHLRDREAGWEDAEQLTVDEAYVDDRSTSSRTANS